MALYRVNKPRHPQAHFHVKKNDEVVVLTGTQQGKRGKVLQVLRDRSRVIIEGVNFIKKAARKSQEPDWYFLGAEVHKHHARRSLRFLVHRHLDGTTLSVGV